MHAQTVHTPYQRIDGLEQAAKRKAHGYTRYQIMGTVRFFIAGKLDFTRINRRAA